MSDLRSLYEEVILDHNRNPRNYLHKPEGANHHAYGFNPLCGDEFTIHLTLKDGVITDVGFEGAGCAISTASASLMTEAIKGMSVAEADALFRSVHNLLTHEGEAGDIGKLQVLSGVHEYPARVKCATLAWHTLNAALHNDKETVTTE
ncbi:MAG: SUF system NifU family Fe-S cluster assembly protein [Gammaproteobacteria bacterium]|nr:SUF system NifU family Fe-S cluster assembly protein [Gammaproteobacteria bacterium]